MQQHLNLKPRTVRCRPVRCHAAQNEKRSSTQGMLAFGAAVALALSPAALPDGADAASYQERMEALQKRKDMLAEARQQAEGGPGVSNAPPEEPKPEPAASSPPSYFDKISGSLSMQMQPGQASEPPKAAEPEPRSLFGGESKSPMAFPSSKPEEKAEAASESKPAFPSFFSRFGGGGDTESKPPPVPEAPKPQASESKPAFSFAAPKQEDAPKAAPFGGPSQPNPAPEVPTKPWWERTEELAGGTTAKKAEEPLQAKKAEPPKVDKKAEKRAAEEAEKKRAEDSRLEAAKKAAALKDGDKGRKRKTNGFALFGSQVLMFGGIAATAYALLFRSEQLSDLMRAADKAILEASERKEGTPSA